MSCCACVIGCVVSSTKLLALEQSCLACVSAINTCSQLSPPHGKAAVNAYCRFISIAATRRRSGAS